MCHCDVVDEVIKILRTLLHTTQRVFVTTPTSRSMILLLPLLKQDALSDLGVTTEWIMSLDVTHPLVD